MVDLAIIVGRAGDDALLIQDPSHVPTVDVPSEADIREVLPILARRLGTEVIPLRVAQVRGTHDDPSLMMVELDAIADHTPPGLAWLDLAAVDPDRFEPPDLRAHMRYWMAARLEGPTARRAPWARPGWHARAASWMTDRMAKSGHPATAAPDYHYLWSISAVLRAESRDGPMYLKACAPCFHGEPTVTAALAERTPDLVTRVAAVEPDEGWLLMHDHGGRVVGDQLEESWGSGLETFATIQRAWDGRASELTAAGARLRPLAVLAERLPDVLLAIEAYERVPESEAASIQASLPSLAAACLRLDAIGPPPGLVHGDLHPWNVAIGPGGPIIFDWSDVLVSHPFLDLPVYVRRAKDTAVRRAIRDAFLARWADVLGAADLAEAGDLALVAGSLLQVESYAEILESLDPEDRNDMAGADLSHLRFAMAALRDGIDTTGTSSD